MKKNYDNAIELFTASEDELKEINKYTLKDLTQDEIFTFKVCLCDTELDRDFDVFTPEALEKLAELFVGKTGICDHDMKAENQVARIYATEVQKSEHKTALGYPYARLRAKAYMLKNEKNQPLIDEICAGIKKEVSINCSVEETVCSICGKNVRRAQCEHTKGKNGCHHLLKNPTDAYEWSFVAVPAQRNAGTVKSFEEKENSSTENLLQIAEKYKSFLKAEIVKLTQAVTPQISVKSINNICSNLSVDELEVLREDYIKAERKRFSPQLAKREATSSNDNFKI